MPLYDVLQTRRQSRVVTVRAEDFNQAVEIANDGLPRDIAQGEAVDGVAEHTPWNSHAPEIESIKQKGPIRYEGDDK